MPSCRAVSPRARWRSRTGRWWPAAPIPGIAASVPGARALVPPPELNHSPTVPVIAETVPPTGA